MNPIWFSEGSTLFRSDSSRNNEAIGRSEILANKLNELKQTKFQSYSFNYMFSCSCDPIMRKRKANAMNNTHEEGTKI